ncbi:Conidial yellow pigment biosynthesis polyketide synthase [Cytospora mali]|uniref:Conidial yellow pigment biosynthesis polyketide synthase n=1 Tax=Cytospora mali TaxID=578113 RepID=A0A194W7Q9_CYTMA|nr:Conidial yellow pigment biosynthesis polyketide synthase [Valsa mali]
MENQEALYLFGDQTFDVEPHLNKLLDAKNSNAILRDFLDKVYDSLRVQIFQLPRHVREELPRFTSIEDVLLWKRSEGSSCCVPLDMAITCMYQLGSFISSQTGNEYPKPEDSCILGLCTGALAAVTVSCSRSLSQLVPQAVDAVVVAFGVGVCVSNMKTRLVSPLEASRTWTMMVAGPSASESVRKFCEESKLPVTAKPFISAYTPSGLAVSGPPSSLDELVSSTHFHGLKHKAKAVYAPYHAPHLYSEADIDDILTPLELDDESQPLTRIRVMSSTGNWIEGTSFRDLMRGALEDILLQPIRWNGILEGLRARLGRSWDPKKCKVELFGSRADQLIYSALKQPTGINRTLTPRPSMNRLSPDQGNPPECTTQARPKIAIIGMSGRFPGGANNSEAFWDLLREGLDVHEEVPPLHWSKAHVDAAGARKNTSATPYGCWLSDPASFDARFFNISPREAPQIDPAQRIALMTAYEALEQAGIVPDATPSTRRDRVGVFYGVTSNDWMETNSAQNIDTYFIPGGNRAFIPGRINYFFKFSGPSYAVDTACSSSLSAIHTAVNSLWQRDIDMAIAGGTNVLTNPDFTAGLDRGHFLSRTGNCRTFDDEADGYCRGEGVGTVILKRLEDAVADKDPVLGVILGAYTNHSAEADSITRPHTGAQRAIFSKILNSSAIDASSVGYIEMHGTGTQAGDATEMASVLNVFAPQGQTARQAPVYLGSAKSNIGHGEAASGVSSLIKVLLMMKNNLIPPHIGIKTKINHKFPTDLEERGVRIAKEAVPWHAAGLKPRRAFVNNFSAAGGNSALLLEEAPAQMPNDQSAAGANLVAVSAKTGPSLQGNLWSLKGLLLNGLLQNNDKEAFSVGQLSYTTTARRIHHQHRVMLVGSTVDELLAQIDVALRDQTGMTRPKNKTPKIIFTFTGQGAQFPGMGRQLMETFALFRTELRQLDHIARSLGFPSIMPVYLAKENQSLDEFPPIQVQLASVCMQIALAHLWASWGIVPEAVVGHSLGEYAALNIAGVLSDSDTIYLVGKRAQLLQDLCTKGTHSMLVARASASTIAAALKSTPHQIACMNSPIETVLAGPNQEIQLASQVLGDAGIKTTRLEIPYAFHSSQVDPILVPFEKAAASVRYLRPKCPVLCPLNGTIITTDGTFGPAYLGRHCREPVNLLQALHSARQAGTITEQSILLEVGPHPAVSGMVKATLGSQMTVISALNRKSARDVLADALKALYQAGAEVAWATYHDDFKASQKVLTGLPAYSWDLKPYWIQYVNDWSLRKGDPPLVVNGAEEQKTKLESTTIHRVVEDSSSEGGLKEHIIVEADIARSDLNPLVKGHMVDDIPLCTPSVYADMALTLGRYLVNRRQGPVSEANKKQVDVSDMTIFKALISKPQGPQPLQGHAEVDWTRNEATMKFVSFDAKGNPQEHAKCTLRFIERSILLKKLQNESAAIKMRMQGLRQGIAKETSARFNRPMVYRMIRPLAQFHDDYRAIDEVVLDSTTLEASASVSFGGIKKGGQFALHPAIIDAFTQSCGFVMNCNDYTNLDTEVYMNHGWGRFQVFEDVYYDRPYTSYTRMIEGDDKLWHGDVVIFDGNKIVAAFEKIAIQCVPRRVLRVILSLESGHKSKKSAPAPPQVSSTSVKTVKAVQTHVETRALTDTNPPTPPPSFSRVPTALQIISEESGVALAELTDNSAFADFGVDSLLGLTISARFREELDLDLDFEAIFVTYPTIGDLKAFIETTGGPAIKIEEHHPSPPPTSYSVVSAAKSGEEAVVTLNTKEDFVKVLTRTKESDGVDFDLALRIISEESGIPMEELTDDTHFVDTGIDSLLSLVIVSRFREELDTEIAMDALFVDCPTVADLRRSMQGESSSVSSGSEDFQDISKGSIALGEKAFGSSVQVRSINLTPSSSETSSNFDESELTQSSTILVPRATSLILQGNPKTANKTLFLFPDGSGSASSYAGIPTLSADTCVVALNSPFLKQADSLRAARLDDVIIDGYLAEIRRRQPRGPYHFGGWSAGGILAYRAAQILTGDRQQVLSLSLIDSPPPLNGLDRLPPHFYEYCESLHLFGHKSSSSSSSAGGGRDVAPAWLIPHFNATIDLLHEYRAAPMRGSGRSASGGPKVSIIWAAACIADNPRLPKLAPHPDDTEGMKFLLERRTNFGANGWGALFPGREGSIIVDRVEGAHHFSMMREPYSQKLAEFLVKAME